VIGVTATNMDDLPLSLSPVGPELELAAPGAGIYSTTANGNYDLLSGTSQAAPHVTGVAALALSSGFDQDLNDDGTVDHRDIRLRLQETALDLGEPGKDSLYGYGLVSAGAADPESQEYHLVVTRLRGHPWASAKTLPLADGVFEITIISNGLIKIDVEVFEEDAHLKELSRSYNFCPKDFSQATFQIDSTASTLRVVFVPRGRPGASADVYIESL
jgi:subtilisin